MTALPLPQWLRDGEPAVAYFPRRDPALAEAWPVLSWKRTDTQVVAQTEVGEIRFRLWDGGDEPSQFGANPTHGARLIPASDPRVVAAQDRTAILRAWNELAAVIRENRPGPNATNDGILGALDEVHAAAEVALEDVKSVLWPSPL